MVKFLRGVVAKPWYFTVLAGSPPKKSIVDPFLTFLVLMRVGTIINQKFLAEIFLGVGG